ncbi:MAG: DUF4365 domain-containing protein [Bacteroidales bacterium]
MKLPKRVPQHISETASFKLFSKKIPDNWIIRELTERDYGIDCYLEMTNDQNELTGELALIQLKSRKAIPWTKDEYYTLTDINISTSNYWYKIVVPVFIFLTDIENQELYFLSVDNYIKRNFKEYAKQDTFNYKIEKSNKFDGEDGVFAFKFHFYYEYCRHQFENELMFFLSNHQNYQDFQGWHNGLDYHLGIEPSDLIFFEAMHRNLKFLSVYLNIDNHIPSLSDLKKRSRLKFPDKHYYELYEHDLTEWSGDYQKLTSEIINKLKFVLKGELDFWQIVNPTVYNYVIRMTDNPQL